MGRWLAENLLHDSVVNMVELPEGYNLARIRVREELVWPDAVGTAGAERNPVESDPGSPSGEVDHRGDEARTHAERRFQVIGR